MCVVFFRYWPQNVVLPVAVGFNAPVERENVERSDNLSESVRFVATFLLDI